MNKAQKAFHARSLATLTVRNHIRMMDESKRGAFNPAKAREAGKKGKKAAVSVPVLRRKKKL